MKILIIMSGFFPGEKYGGPPVSVNNFCTLMEKHECYIITHNHDMGETEAYIGLASKCWIDRNNCRVMYLQDEMYNIHIFEKIILELKPDILYLQGLFQQCIWPCLRLAKKHEIKVLLAPRGELCAGALKKKYKKIPYILFLKANRLLKDVSFQATSTEEMNAIKKYLCKDIKRIYALANIPSIPKKIFSRDEKRRGEGKFVFLSRIHPKKNLVSAIRYFNYVKGNVTFDIYGTLEDQEYWVECKREISKLPQNVKVNYQGVISHDAVHDAFSHYHAFIFPTFSENYGHVIAESLLVGTPTIISDNTPWTDINDAHAGWAISLDAFEQYVEAIQKIIDMCDSEYKELSNRSIVYGRKKCELDKLLDDYERTLLSVAGGIQ